MIDDYLMTFVIFALGVATVWLSIYSCFMFQRFRVRLSSDADLLSSAISWQLIGEAIIGLGTLAFSMGEFFGWLEFWSIDFKSTIRFVMFMATSVTTWHLVQTLKRLRANG